MVSKILLERGNNSENGGEGGVDVEMGGLPLFLLLFSQNAFALCLGGVKFVLLHFDSSVV